MALHTAIALLYTDAADAPLVIAHGKNELADRMIIIAKENGIQIVRDQFLADILTDVEIGACIPPETYGAVATIFAFLEKGIEEQWFSKS